MADLDDFIPEVLAECMLCPIRVIRTNLLRILFDFCKHTKLWTSEQDARAISAYVDEYALTSTLGKIVGVSRVEVDHRKIKNLSEKETDADRAVWRTGTASGPMAFLYKPDKTLQLIYKPTEDSDVNYTLADLTFTASGNTITTAAGDFAAAGIQASQILDIIGSVSNDGTYHLDSVAAGTIVTKEPLVNEGAADAPGTFIVGGLTVWVCLAPLLTATTVEDFLYDDWMDAIVLGTKARLMRMIKQPWGDLELSSGYQDLYEQERGKAVREKQDGGGGSIMRGGVGI